MLRIFQARQFIFAKFASLLRGEGRDEMRAGDSFGEAPCITRSAVDQHASVVRPPSDHAIAVPTTKEMPDREKLIRRRWLETGIKPNALGKSTTGNNLGVPQTGGAGPAQASHGNAVDTPAANAATQSLGNTDAGVLKK